MIWFKNSTKSLHSRLYCDATADTRPRSILYRQLPLQRATWVEVVCSNLAVGQPLNKCVRSPCMVAPVKTRAHVRNMHASSTSRYEVLWRGTELRVHYVWYDDEKNSRCKACLPIRSVNCTNNNCTKTCFRIYQTWWSDFWHETRLATFQSKPHKCQECGKTFGRRSDLNRHMRGVHMRERPHSCNKCGWTFAEAGNLKHHMQVSVYWRRNNLPLYINCHISRHIALKQERILRSPTFGETCSTRKC